MRARLAFCVLVGLGWNTPFSVFANEDFSLHCRFIGMSAFIKDKRSEPPHSFSLGEVQLRPGQSSLIQTQGIDGAHWFYVVTLNKIDDLLDPEAYQRHVETVVGHAYRLVVAWGIDRQLPDDDTRFNWTSPGTQSIRFDVMNTGELRYVDAQILPNSIDELGRVKNELEFTTQFPLEILLKLRIEKKMDSQIRAYRDWTPPTSLVEDVTFKVVLTYQAPK